MVLIILISHKNHKTAMKTRIFVCVTLVGGITVPCISFSCFYREQDVLKVDCRCREKGEEAGRAGGVATDTMAASMQPHHA